VLIFGSSKTIRGVVASILVTIILAPLAGATWQIGTLVAISANAGDLFSSFCKRRMGLPPSAMVIGLDQIPESLFPSLACKLALPLTIFDIATVTAAFSLAALGLQFGLKLPHDRDGARTSTPSKRSR
jgi:CDP-2,3-bis-(O-geranylgeranyl)-sn-glycerol synthase